MPSPPISIFVAWAWYFMMCLLHDEFMIFIIIFFVLVMVVVVVVVVVMVMVMMVLGMAVEALYPCFSIRFFFL